VKDPVFLGEHGGTMDGSALRRRYLKDRDAAGLRQLRFHDLRHIFGSLAINFASIVHPGVDGPRQHHDDHALPAP
jgi:integrase